MADRHGRHRGRSGQGGLNIPRPPLPGPDPFDSSKVSSWQRYLNQTVHEAIARQRRRQARLDALDNTRRDLIGEYNNRTPSPQTFGDHIERRAHYAEQKYRRGGLANLLQSGAFRWLGAAGAAATILSIAKEWADGEHEGDELVLTRDGLAWVPPQTTLTPDDEEAIRLIRARFEELREEGASWGETIQATASEVIDTPRIGSLAREEERRRNILGAGLSVPLSAQTGRPTGQAVPRHVARPRGTSSVPTVTTREVVLANYVGYERAVTLSPADIQAQIARDARRRLPVISRGGRGRLPGEATSYYEYYLREIREANTLDRVDFDQFNEHGFERPPRSYRRPPPPPRYRIPYNTIGVGGVHREYEF